MSEPDTSLDKRRSAREFVEKVFVPAEEHAVLLVTCAAWIFTSLQAFRHKADGQESLGIPPFPDKHMRTFEELGREMDDYCRRIHQELPLTDKGEG